MKILNSPQKTLDSSSKIISSIRRITPPKQYDFDGVALCMHCNSAFFIYAVKKYHCNRPIKINCPYCNKQIQVAIF